MSHNIAVVVLDTTRALDTVPADPELTPTLADLAERGTEYTQAFAAAPWTLPSHASLFTGTYPSNHGAHGEHTLLDDTYSTLAETFGAAGYETVFASNNTWVTGEFGFDRGFDTSRAFGDASGDRHPEEIPVGGRAPDATDDGAARTVGWLRDWLGDRAGDDPFFVFANFVEPHLEYRPPRAYAEAFLPEGWSYDAAMDIPQDPRAFDAGAFDLSEAEFAALRGLYRAEIAYLDERIGDLVAAIEAAGEREDIVVVVGDHGENIGEHGLLGHQYRLTDTLLHVPLVIDGGPFVGGGTVDDLVQVLDLAPTLLATAGIGGPDIGDHHQGRSLHPEARTVPREAVFAEYMAPQPGVETLEEQYDDLPEELYDYERSLRAVRTDRYKYVRGSDGSERLYDLAADPGETTDRSGDQPAVAAALEDRLDTWLSSFDHADADADPDADADAADTVTIDDATEQRLSNLGYM